jgi:hypothetical protein
VVASGTVPESSAVLTRVLETVEPSKLKGGTTLTLNPSSGPHPSSEVLRGPCSLVSKREVEATYHMSGAAPLYKMGFDELPRRGRRHVPGEGEHEQVIAPASSMRAAFSGEA